MKKNGIEIHLAGREDEKYAKIIVDEMELSARLRGSGISKRSPGSIVQKMREGKAVIALAEDGTWAGFSYIEVWSNGAFVSNSGLIISPAYRLLGVAKAIKKEVFELSRSKYPLAKVITITTGLAIMKMNSALGFKPVTFSEIPKEKAFWEGCKSCVNYGILKSKNFKNCLCTAMLHPPKVRENQKEENTDQ